jgi:hypothetical protein
LYTNLNLNCTKRVIQMPKFKDYEIGWYGHTLTYNSMWMGSYKVPPGYAHSRVLNGRTRNEYSSNRNNIMKQLDSLKGVVFVYGDYKASV